jgi:hypothetical protein
VALAVLLLLLQTEVYLCSLHRDVQATAPGTCSTCGRELVQRFLVSSYSCPMHPSIDEEESGNCPLCGMTLVPTTRELQWSCPDRPEILKSSPGVCSDGKLMDRRSLPMAHGDHNARHGGILFMAPNGYHHLEGTLAEDGTFRLYLYDDFTRAIDPRGFRARIDDAILTLSPDGAHLETRLSRRDSADRTDVVLHLRFPGDEEPEGHEARFDFVFVPDAAPSLALPEFRIPAAAEDIYSEILRRDRRIQDLIQRGSWPDLYIPALEAKDLTLALVDREGERVAVAAKKIVRAAWLLDTYGDLGNRLEVESAYRLFEEGIRQLEEASAR